MSEELSVDRFQKHLTVTSDALKLVEVVREPDGSILVRARESQQAKPPALQDSMGNEIEEGDWYRGSFSDGQVFVQQVRYQPEWSAGLVWGGFSIERALYVTTDFERVLVAPWQNADRDLLLNAMKMLLDYAGMLQALSMGERHRQVIATLMAMRAVFDIYDPLGEDNGHANDNTD